LEADLAAGVFHEKTSNEVSEKRHRRLHGHPGFIENRPANHATERSDFINEGVLPFDFENQLDKEMTAERKIQDRFHQVLLQKEAARIQAVGRLVHMAMLNVNTVQEVNNVLITD